MLPDYSSQVESAAKEATTGERIEAGGRSSGCKGVQGTSNERSLPVHFSASQCIPRPSVADGPTPAEVSASTEGQALQAVKGHMGKSGEGRVAGRRGLEPPTLGSTVRYSIQLS